jgi:predicted DNA binding protein
MMQIAFRLKTSCQLAKLTAEHPSLTILDWCNFNFEFYELRSTKVGELESVIPTFLKLRQKIGFSLQRQDILENNTAVFVMKCKHNSRGSLQETMYKFSSLVLYPFLLREGWVWISTICFDEKSVPEMLTNLSEFGELKMTSKVKMNPESLEDLLIIPASNIVSNLTTRQAEALLVAVDQGYYQVPRKVRFEDLSKIVNVPRTTYEEHVRKAESKVIKATAPYLSVYFGRSCNGERLDSNSQIDPNEHRQMAAEQSKIKEIPAR